MEIHNLYSLDIFLQGIFLLFCVCAGVYLVFKDNLESFREVDSLNQFSNSLYDLFIRILGILSFKSLASDDKVNYKYFGTIPLIVAASFILGILGNGLADKWIDSESKNHLEMKSLWRGNLLKVGEYNTSFKNKIRLKSFEDVFGVDSDTIKARIPIQLYYQSKHELLDKKHYYNYVRKSQAMSEYSRVFSLGFFFLMVCGFLNLLIMIFRVLFSTRINSEKYENEDIVSKLPKKKRLSKIVNISNGVIFIFSLFSFLYILLLIDPDFRHFEKITPMYLSVVLLTYFGCFTFLLFIFRKFWNLRFSFFLYSIIYVFSLIGYFTSSKIWLASERKVALKVYGIYKSSHLSNSIEEIKFAKEKLELNNVISDDSKKTK